jgi:transcriptional regulator with XRE-family HTH domain
MKTNRAVGERRKPTDVDILVGGNVRRLRQERGATLSEAAIALNMSHQQLQKYETGINRISAGVLVEIAKYFEISVESLFEEPGSKGGAPEARLRRVRGKCHYLVDHTSSLEVLNTMARVLRVLPSD